MYSCVQRLWKACACVQRLWKVCSCVQRLWKVFREFHDDRMFVRAIKYCKNCLSEFQDCEECVHETRDRVKDVREIQDWGRYLVRSKHC